MILNALIFWKVIFVTLIVENVDVNCIPDFQIQWNLSNPTHQETNEMCRIVQDVGILRFYFSKQKYFGTINFCQMSQDVGKLRCLDCTSSTVISKFISDIIIRIIFVLFFSKKKRKDQDLDKKVRVNWLLRTIMLVLKKIRVRNLQKKTKIILRKKTNSQMI